MFSRCIRFTGHSNLVLTPESISKAAYFWWEMNSLVSMIIFALSPDQCAASTSTVNISILLSLWICRLLLLNFPFAGMYPVPILNTSAICCFFFLQVICLIYLHLFFFCFSDNLNNSWGTCCFICVLSDQLHPWKFQGFFCKHMIIFLKLFFLTLKLFLDYLASDFRDISAPLVIGSICEYELLYFSLLLIYLSLSTAICQNIAEWSTHAKSKWSFVRIFGFLLHISELWAINITFYFK